MSSFSVPPGACTREISLLQTPIEHVGKITALFERGKGDMVRGRGQVVWRGEVDRDADLRAYRSEVDVVREKRLDSRGAGAEKGLLAVGKLE